MPRPLVIGNGRLLVTLDRELSIRDFYWPYVGLHNHLSGNRGLTGVWVEGAFSWLSGESWARTLGYRDNTLVTHVVAQNDALRVALDLEDCVVHDSDVLLRHLRLRNLEDRAREARIFFAHDF